MELQSNANLTCITCIYDFNLRQVRERKLFSSSRGITQKSTNQNQIPTAYDVSAHAISTLCIHHNKS
jgi:hypothetical protein